MEGANAVDLLNTIATTEISLIYCEANNSSDMPGRGPTDEGDIIAAVNYKRTVDENR